MYLYLLRNITWRLLQMRFCSTEGLAPRLPNSVLSANSVDLGCKYFAFSVVSEVDSYVVNSV